MYQLVFQGELWNCGNLEILAWRAYCCWVFEMARTINIKETGNKTSWRVIAK